jgi:hypothetical protein
MHITHTTVIKAFEAMTFKGITVFKATIGILDTVDITVIKVIMDIRES